MNETAGGPGELARREVLRLIGTPSSPYSISAKTPQDLGLDMDIPRPRPTSCPGILLPRPRWSSTIRRCPARRLRSLGISRGLVRDPAFPCAQPSAPLPPES